MIIENYKKASELISQINEKKHELNAVNDLIENASGTTQVKINTRWIIQMPSQTLKGHAQSRKKQLEDEFRALESQFAQL